MTECEVLKAVEEYVKSMGDVWRTVHNLMVELEECVRDHDKALKLADKMDIYECELQDVCDMFPKVFESDDVEVIEVLERMGVIR